MSIAMVLVLRSSKSFPLSASIEAIFAPTSADTFSYSVVAASNSSLAASISIVFDSTMVCCRSISEFACVNFSLASSASIESAFISFSVLMSFSLATPKVICSFKALICSS